MAAAGRAWHPFPQLVASVAAGLLVVVVWIGFATPAPVATPSVPSSPPPASGGSGPPLAAPNVTVVPSGTEWQLEPGHFKSVLVELTLAAHVSGGYVASTATGAEVFDAADFGEFEATGTATSTAWSLPPSAGGNLSFALPSGTWYLVFVNTDDDAPGLVAITESVQASFPLPAAS